MNFAWHPRRHNQLLNMAGTGYQPVPHDADFRHALLAQPGVQKAFDALEVEYTALHAKLDDRRTAKTTPHVAQVRPRLRKEAADSDGLKQ
jgi:hypothetical protein